MVGGEDQKKSEKAAALSVCVRVARRSCFFLVFFRNPVLGWSHSTVTKERKKLPFYGSTDDASEKEKEATGLKRRGSHLKAIDQVARAKRASRRRHAFSQRAALWGVFRHSFFLPSRPSRTVSQLCALPPFALR